MNDWKDLDISNIPSDFFVNERYEIEIYGITSQWLRSDLEYVDSRYQIIQILRRDNDKYRYRLKPLEPIRITEDIQKILFKYIPEDNFEGLIHNPTYKELTSWGGIPVEIID